VVDAPVDFVLATEEVELVRVREEVMLADPVFVVLAEDVREVETSELEELDDMLLVWTEEELEIVFTELVVVFTELVVGVVVLVRTVGETRVAGANVLVSNGTVGTAGLVGAA
jgi:hypothetical protein